MSAPVPVINYARQVNRVKKVHDGDTFLFEIDQGCGDARELWVRLSGIDTWELNDPNGLGKQAQQYVQARFDQAKVITIQTFKTSTGSDVMTFIRYVADIWVDGQPLAPELRTLGYAKTNEHLG